MNPGIYWYRGPIQSSWNSDDPWKQTKDWMVVSISNSLGMTSGCMLGTEATIWEDDLKRMEIEGSFVEIPRPNQ